MNNFFAVYVPHEDMYPKCNAPIINIHTAYGQVYWTSVSH